MRCLFISGTAGSGKTAVALGLAQKFAEKGVRVTYFKPVGTAPEGKKDPDAELMQAVLKTKDPLEKMMPLTLGPHYLYRAQPTSPFEKILVAWEALKEEADLVLAEAPFSPFLGASLGVETLALACALKANLLLVSAVADDFDLDELVALYRYFRREVPVLGNVFNHVSRTLLSKVEGIYRPLLEKEGCRVLGIVPQHPEISYPTVAEFYEQLGGELLAGEGSLGRLVESVVVGAMTMESALGYLRRAPNKAFITGGDRADLALAALETSTSVVVLTGGFYPNVAVITRANEKKVPVILVPDDTYATVEKLHFVTRRIRAQDQKAIQVAQESVARHCAWEEILTAL